MPITLLCLVKGNTLANVFSVDIEKDQLVCHLKEFIKAKKQNDFAGVDADKLRLWKVEIGDDHQLRNLNDSDELMAINKIGDYWTKKPPKRHIHVLIEPPASTARIRKLTSLEELNGSEFHEPPNKRVKTDDEVNNFWRDLKKASLTNQFLRLPNNTRFLGKEHGLSNLYIRRCYKDFEHIVFDDAINKLRISGNPGIGKTIFGYYLLYLLAKKNATIVFDSCKEKKSFVFNGEHAFRCNDDEIDLYLLDARVWYIVDGKEPKDVNAKTILICSSKRDHYKHFDNYEGKIAIRYMPIWSWKEIKQCRKYIYNDKIDERLARDLFSKWGGIPRYVLEKANEKVYQNMLKDAIYNCKEDIFDYVGESDVERTLSSHMIVHIHVNLPVKDDKEVGEYELSQYSETQLQLDRNGITPYTETILRFASNYVLEQVTELLETRMRERLRDQIKAGTGNSLLGNAFEYIAHKMLRNGGNFEVRPLDEYSKENIDDPAAKVNLSQQNLPLYFKSSSIDKIKDGMYYQAWESNFPSLDSVITPNKVFQMTIAKHHPIKMNGLKALCNKFGDKSAKELIYYYFVVPEYLYDDYKVQKFVTSKEKDAKIIPNWIDERVFQYVLKIKL
ncbi:hypothetical protein RclHR1_06950008 [Rhizophagus clarus]|uniref:Crinkler (CRN) family protein, putative n=1 Tax=Rhizophagus clarus TaxID=94130 RepID=A0A2Z6SBH9_9GLOM|nr:hypothetical protein RclHR1_06950008 [Rhizophagus clarus]GES87351.1 crinkler (CRN) family protein, putative [Rhizophagus clarus]